MALTVFGTNVFGVRLLSALGGLLSIVTAAALARALLPRGGAALAVLVLAGLRWHLILSRWSWNMIVIAPILDVAALCAIAARRRRSLAAAASAGVLVGVGAHVYLSAWIGLGAVLLLVVWPDGSDAARGSRAVMASAVLAGFLVAVSPLFLLRRRPRDAVLRPVEPAQRDRRDASERFGCASPGCRRRWTDGSLAPAGSRAAPRHSGPETPSVDRRHRPRGGARPGAPAAGRGPLGLSLRQRRGGPRGVRRVGRGALAQRRPIRIPDECRCRRSGCRPPLARLARPADRRRAAARIAVGCVAIAGVLGARDLVLWADLKPTFDRFIGQETLVGRAAMRWDRYGQVRLEFAGLYSPLVVDTIRRLRVAPRAEIIRPDPAEGRARRVFRFLAPGSGRFRRRAGRRARARRLGPGMGRRRRLASRDVTAPAAVRCATASSGPGSSPRAPGS